MARKCVFITGIAGFIGFHLARFLQGLGNRVVGIDNFNDYYTPTLKRDRARILRQEHIEVVEMDICQSCVLNELLQKNQVTHVVHLAAQAGVRYSLTNPHLYLRSNIDGFLNILEACRAHPHIKLIYASSSSVYGLNQKVPFSVGDRTDDQASLYGVTKKTNELMAKTYHHLFGISSIGLRFFTVYGPWGRPDMAYFLFTEAILGGSPIQVYNQGKMSRDFTYIDDIIEGTAAALEHCEGCEVFNLGNHHPEELGTMIALIEKALGKKGEKRMLPMQQGDVVSTYADIEKSQVMLGFSPKVSLEDGISRFIAWHKEYYPEKHSGL